MKYLKIPIVDIDDGINNEMMITSDAVVHLQEPTNLIFEHLIKEANTPTMPSPKLKLLLEDKAYTVSNEKSFEVTTTSEDSLVFVKLEYAIDVTTGKPMQVYHSVNHDMGDKHKVTIFLKSDKTALCSISVYEMTYVKSVLA